MFRYDSNSLAKFIKPSILSSKKYISDLISIDCEDNNNCVTMKKVSISFAASECLKKLDISEAKLVEFKHACFNCYQCIMLKLVKRKSSPCNYSLISHLSCLSPRYIVTHANSNVEKFENVLSTIGEHGFVKVTDGDALLKEYKNFCKLLRLEKKDECLEYTCGKSKRVDVFFYEVIGTKDNYAKL